MGQVQSNGNLATNINLLANTIKNSNHVPEPAIEQALLRFHNTLLGNSILPDGVSDGFILAITILFSGLLGLVYMNLKGLRRDSNEHQRLLHRLQDKQESLAVSIESHSLLIDMIRKKDKIIQELLVVNEYSLNITTIVQVRIYVFHYNH